MLSSTLRRCLYFIESGRRTVWLALVVLALFVTALEVGSALLIFVVLQLVIDPGMAAATPAMGLVVRWLPVTRGQDPLAVAMIIVVVFFLLRGAVVLAQSYLQARIAEGAGVRLSSRLFAGYLRMPYSFHLRRNSAELIRNVNDAVIDVVSYTLVAAVRLASEFLVVVGLSLAMVIMAPVAALLALVLFAPLMVGLLRFVQPRIAALGRQSHELAETTLEVLQHSLQGFRDIRVLGRETFFHRRYVATREGIARTRYLRQVLADVPRVALETELILFVAVVVLAAVTAGGSPQQTLAVLGVFAYAGLRILPSLNRAVLQVNELRFGAAAAAAVYDELVGVEPATSHPEATHPVSGLRRALPLREGITLRSVHYRYPGAHRDALMDVDLTISPGESIGVVGPTGGGKSTLIDVVLGLLPPTSGEVQVDGIDIQKDLQGWQRNLGVVPQTIFLLDDTLRRNIALGLEDHEIDDRAVQAAAQLAQLDDVTAELPQGLDTRVGERGIRLSGGQRQRVAIARALYRQPAVLVFDEGTSALDSLTEADLVAALDALRGERTMITVAHRITTVRRCDRIVLIEVGRVADIGTFEALIERNPVFRDLAGQR
jgi:ATP-binding cassette, subfamily B, bacterial PglK